MPMLGEWIACGVLRAEDYDRAKRFYMDVVGLTLTHESAGPPREGGHGPAAGLRSRSYET